jgi:multidrug transporter EmrE-like cation transporter
MVGLQFWLRLALAGVIGIAGLLDASAAQGSTRGTVGFLIFLAAVAYGFYLLKQTFDRIERARE